MKSIIHLLAACLVAGTLSLALAEEPAAERMQLKDGSTLYLHPDGTSRMVDQHGKPMAMADGVEMELADGQVIMMKNHKVWVQHGPPGKGPSVLKTD